MITGITIENFKGIRERVTLDFRPITLLFGANSAGKSTVMYAMDYLHAILETQSPIPELYSDKWKAGFSRLVHASDEGREITIGITCELSDDDLGYFAIRGHTSTEIPGDWSAPVLFDSLFHEAPSPMSLEITIASNPGLFMESLVNGAIVRRFRLSYQEIQLIEIEALPTERRGLPKYVWRVNLDHDLLCAHAERSGTLEFICRSRDIFPNPSDPPLSDGFYEAIPGADEIPNDTIANLLNSLVTASFQIAKYRLKRSRRIGALRVIPEATFLPRPSMDATLWHDGLAAWNDLAYCGEDHMIDINDWLMRIGTRCILIQQKLVDLREAQQLFKHPPNSHEYASALVKAHTNAVRQVRLVRANNEDEAATFFWNPLAASELLCPVDFGTGISQLVPIVVACRDSSSFFWSIMQPELHLHPRMQAELGDLFIDSVNRFKHGFLIETHSENLLLRMMRRIRETAKTRQPNGLELRTNEIAIYFFQQTDGRTTATKIDVDINGDFIQPWPDDFFEIDFYERFS